MTFLKRLLIVLFVIALVPAGALAIFCLPDPVGGVEDLPKVEDVAAPGRRYDVDAVGYRRGEEATWLSLPQWQVVYGAADYADHVATRAPSGFAYFASIGQFWTAYCRMHHLTTDRYRVGTGLHAMNLLAGTSFTIEYALQGLYENTVGRLTEAIGGTDTVEDRHSRAVAREYVDFLRQAPWYDFPFFGRIGGMWTEIDFSSPDVFRRVERRVALTLGYTVRGLYGWLARIAAGLSSGAQDEGTMVVVDTLPTSVLARNPQARVLKPVGDSAQLVMLPRHAGFTGAVLKLVRDGAVVREIAGNDEILLTVIAPREWTSQSLNAVVLFSMPVLADLSRHRFALWVRVAALHDVVRSLDGSGVTIEHIHDY